MESVKIVTDPEFVAIVTVKVEGTIIAVHVKVTESVMLVMVQAEFVFLSADGKSVQDVVEAEIVFIVKEQVDLLSVKIVTGLENVAHVKVRQNVKNAKVMDILLMSFNLYGINNKSIALTFGLPKVQSLEV